VTMYLLDTNVVSMFDENRQRYEPKLIDWVRRNGSSLFISVMTISEMDKGVLKLRRNGKTERADEVVVLIAKILAAYSDRVLPVDLATARHLAHLVEETHQLQVGLVDLIIAATAARHGLVVLTRNMKDFGRLSVKAVDPFVALPEDS
jgi:toxin FitB